MEHIGIIRMRSGRILKPFIESVIYHSLSYKLQKKCFTFYKDATCWLVQIMLVYRVKRHKNTFNSQFSKVFTLSELLGIMSVHERMHVNV